MTGGWDPFAAWPAWTVAFAAAGLAAVVGCRKLETARDAAVAGLVHALAAKDPYTGEHTERVARYSVYIGKELGFSRRRLRRLRQAALLHDVGKLAVPNALLNKPDRLTHREFGEVQRHVSAATEIIGAIDVLRPLAVVAEGHHRRFDGGGYGRGGTSKDAAVVAVADAYDAMTSTRPYRRALPQATAFAELRARAGTQFDPVCVAALVTALGRRGERHGPGWERSRVEFAVEPPIVGVGSAGLLDAVPR